MQDKPWEGFWGHVRYRLDHLRVSPHHEARPSAVLTVFSKKREPFFARDELHPRPNTTNVPGRLVAPAAVALTPPRPSAAAATPGPAARLGPVVSPAVALAPAQETEITGNASAFLNTLPTKFIEKTQPSAHDSSGSETAGAAPGAVASMPGSASLSPEGALTEVASLDELDKAVGLPSSVKIVQNGYEPRAFLNQNTKQWRIEYHYTGEPKKLASGETCFPAALIVVTPKVDRDGDPIGRYIKNSFGQAVAVPSLSVTAKGGAGHLADVQNSPLFHKINLAESLPWKHHYLPAVQKFFPDLYAYDPEAPVAVLRPSMDRLRDFCQEVGTQEMNLRLVHGLENGVVGFKSCKMTSALALQFAQVSREHFLDVAAAIPGSILKDLALSAPDAFRRPDVVAALVSEFVADVASVEGVPRRPARGGWEGLGDIERTRLLADCGRVLSSFVDRWEERKCGSFEYTEDAEWVSPAWSVHATKVIESCKFAWEKEMCKEMAWIVSKVMSHAAMRNSPDAVGMLVGSILAGFLLYSQNAKEDEKVVKARLTLFVKLIFAAGAAVQPWVGVGGPVAETIVEQLFEAKTYDKQARLLQAIFHMAARRGAFGFNRLERIELIDSMRLTLTANDLRL